MIVFRQVVEGDKLATIREENGLANNDPVPKHLLRSALQFQLEK